MGFRQIAAHSLRYKFSEIRSNGDLIFWRQINSLIFSPFVTLVSDVGGTEKPKERQMIIEIG